MHVATKPARTEGIPTRSRVKISVFSKEAIMVDIVDFDGDVVEASKRTILQFRQPMGKSGHGTTPDCTDP